MEASDRPVRVLVVEDDQEIAQVLQRSLRMEGYDVKLTGDGAQALDDTQAFLPDLIVLDLGLPGMDGIEVARQLRRDEDDTPILILTARPASVRLRRSCSPLAARGTGRPRATPAAPTTPSSSRSSARSSWRGCARC